MDYLTYSEKVDAFKYLTKLKATGPPRECARRLELSERTVKRIAHRLRERGTPIFFDRAVQSYILLDFN